MSEFLENGYADPMVCAGEHIWESTIRPGAESFLLDLWQRCRVCGEVRQMRVMKREDWPA